MMTKAVLRGLLNRRKKVILSALELLGLDRDSFAKIRKLVLDQLGEGGLEGDLVPLLVEGESEGNGTGRNRRGMKGGAP